MTATDINKILVIEPIAKPFSEQMQRVATQKGQLAQRQIIKMATPAEVAPCFAVGTSLETAEGPLHIENVKAGMSVRNASGHLVPVRDIVSFEFSADDFDVNADLKPIRIAAGALGKGMPVEEILVSRKQRITLSTAAAAHMFGTAEVILAVEQLLPLPGFTLARDIVSVTYFVLIIDSTEVLIAGGAKLEIPSVLPTPVAKIPGAAQMKPVFKSQRQAQCAMPNAKIGERASIRTVQTQFKKHRII